MPTLLVHGDHDRIGDIAASLRTWAGRDPNARYAVIPDAGHASNLDNPDAFTAVLDDFLTEVVPTDPSADDIVFGEGDATPEGTNAAGPRPRGAYWASRAGSTPQR